MANGRPGPEPRLLPGGVTEERLREAVASSRSWREVMQRLGVLNKGAGRKLRNACTTLEIDYGHFRSILATDARLREVITTSADWPTALALLGYAKNSGSARATVRKHCNRLGVDTTHLAPSPPPDASSALFLDLVPKRQHLRDAGPHLVLFAFIAAGHLTRSEYDGNGYGGHRRAAYSSEENDYFACIDGDLQLYLIPIEVVEGQATLQLRKYAPYRVTGLYGDQRLI